MTSVLSVRKVKKIFNATTLQNSYHKESFPMNMFLWTAGEGINSSSLSTRHQRTGQNNASRICVASPQLLSRYAESPGSTASACVKQRTMSVNHCMASSCAQLQGFLLRRNCCFTLYWVSVLHPSQISITFLLFVSSQGLQSQEGDLVWDLGVNTCS